MNTIPLPRPLDDSSTSLFGHRDRLRQKVLQGGLDSMSSTDLLELLLCYAIPRGDVRPMARRLLAEGSLGGLLFRTPEELTDLPGVGKHTASLLALVARIHRELVAEREKARQWCHDPEELVPWFRAEIGLFEEERFAVVFLDHGKRIVGREVFEAGSRTRTVLYPRQLFGRALRCKATSMVLAHNHPGGNCVPSTQDRELTRRIVDIGLSLEVQLYDHLIITRDSYVSFLRQGWL